MSASSQRFGFTLPASTQTALAIARGANRQRHALKQAHSPLNIGSGDPAFITPEHIRDAAKAAIDAGHTHYERNLELREAIAEMLQAQHRIHIDPLAGLVVTPGAHLALFDLFRAWIDAGDEVILADPGSYFEAHTLANGGVPVRIPLRPERGFRLDPDEVEAAITPRTKMLAITNPEAPTTSVHRRADLERLAEIAELHNLMVVSDELYAAITFDEAEHISFASLPGMAARTLTINGFSKAWAMTGWRVGYVAGDPQLIEPVAAINHLNCIALNSIAQFAALAALRGPQGFLADARSVYRTRRDLLVERIRAIPGLDCLTPEGTYYVWVDHRALSRSSVRFQQHCLQNHSVTFNPGTTFGRGGEGFARLSTSPTPPVLEAGLARLAEAVTSWRDGTRAPTSA